MSDRVTTEISGHVAIVTLNRPEKKNAADLAMFEALIEAGAAIASTPSIRAVVLCGAGGNFCAGIDVSLFRTADPSALDPAHMLPLDGSPANFFQQAAYTWRQLPVPVVAAIDGCAFGAGLQIAAGADIRYASVDARLSIMEIRWGIVPDMAISVTLRDVMPLDRLRELAYSGRVVGGAEARELGLVTAVREDPHEAACELAAEIAGWSPAAVRALKQLLNTGWNEPAKAALRREAKLQSSLLGKPAQREAVAANKACRRPVFDDPES